MKLHTKYKFVKPFKVEATTWSKELIGETFQVTEDSMSSFYAINVEGFKLPFLASKKKIQKGIDSGGIVRYEE